MFLISVPLILFFVWATEMLLIPLCPQTEGFLHQVF